MVCHGLISPHFFVPESDNVKKHLASNNLVSFLPPVLGTVIDFIVKRLFYKDKYKDKIFSITC